MTDEAKPTIKSNTSHNLMYNSNNLEKSIYSNMTDKAKPTIKSNTSHNLVLNTNKQEKSIYSNLTDNAKPTIRPEISHNLVLNTNAQDKSIYSNLTDDAKPTIKEQTEITKHINHANNPTLNYTINYTDITKPTIKQTTILNNYISNLTGNIENKISHTASNNMTIKDKREIGTYNRMTNGKKDLYEPHITSETVELNNPILISYFSHPYKKLDRSIIHECNEQGYEDIKHKLAPDKYYISNNYINTLKSNPLVPKNIINQ